MNFSDSNDGIYWSPDFGPGSVILTVKDLVQENDELDVDAPFRLGIDTPFSPTALEDLEMVGSAGKPILLDEEEDN